MTWSVVRNSKNSLGIYHARHGKIEAMREVPTKPCVGSGVVPERLPGTGGL